jgi:hypothetical protein
MRRGGGPKRAVLAGVGRVLLELARVLAIAIAAIAAVVLLVALGMWGGMGQP